MYRVCWLICIMFFVFGCSSGKPSHYYASKELKVAYEVQYGKIVAIRDAYLEGTYELSAPIGGTIGALVGANIKGGSATLNVIAGGALGGIVVSFIERYLTQGKAFEIEVELENGENISIIQKINDKKVFNIQDKVKILSSKKDGAKILKIQ